MSEKINVLLIEPGKYPKQIEIEDWKQCRKP